MFKLQKTNMKNNAIYIDSKVTDKERRELLYSGQLFVYTPTPASLKLAAFAQELSKEAFQPYDPNKAQFEMAPAEYMKILADLKPKFIHHPESKRLIQQMLGEMGCELAKTYFDVPRLRTATSDNYLTSGLALTFEAHRDTWFSAPHSQLNWWIPVYDITPENCLAFHPAYFEKAIKNTSSGYNYYRWNKESRGIAATMVGKDTRVLPKIDEEIDLDPQTRIVCPVGGIVIFSGAQLHSTVPNTSGVTRFSIDFRTVNSDDVAANHGAPNVDSACTGTTMRDYLSAADLSKLPSELVAPYDTEPVPDDAVLVFGAKK
jgi:hypothetical protein